MTISYRTLWKLLIDRDMKKKDLSAKANICDYTIAKMSKGENVTTDVLVKIYTVLACGIENILEIVPKKD